MSLICRMQPYRLVAPFTKWHSALLSAAGDPSGVFGCLAYSHCVSVWTSAAVRRGGSYDIAMAGRPCMKNFCHSPRYQSRVTSVYFVSHWSFVFREEKFFPESPLYDFFLNALRGYMRNGQISWKISGIFYLQFPFFSFHFFWQVDNKDSKNKYSNIAI